MTAYPEKGGPPQTLGQLAQASRARSPQQRAQRYALLLQTERNLERAKKHAEILKDSVFLGASDAVGLKPSRRQASKWRRKCGLAYTQGRRKAA